MNNYDEQLIKKYLPQDKWTEAINKLSTGYPVQYIIGNVDFYDCEINVNEDVLIPRFETEYLVDDLTKHINQRYSEGNVLDIGTGSGCIAIALAKNTHLDVFAIDKSLNAINLAIINAKKNNVKVSFEHVAIEDYDTNVLFDVIVSNPPYVPITSIVDPKTKYEPQDAIFAIEDGLYFYRVILEKSKTILKSKSIIAFEIGDGQANDIVLLAKQYYPKAKIIAKNDLNGLNRYMYIINE